MNQDNYFSTHFHDNYEAERNNPTSQKKINEIKALGYKSGRLLDIGCAYGFLLELADKEGFETFGVDISDHALREAQKYTKARLIKKDLSHEKLGLTNIDVCTMLNITEHIPNYESALKEIHKALRKDGLLYIFTPTEGRWLTDPTHINYFTIKTLKFVLEKNGFKVIKVGEEGGRWQIPLGIVRLMTKGNTNFNFVPEGTGSFISCFAIKT